MGVHCVNFAQDTTCVNTNDDLVVLAFRSWSLLRELPTLQKIRFGKGGKG